MARTLVTLLVEIELEVPQAIQVASDMAHHLRQRFGAMGHNDAPPRVVIARAERAYEGPAVIDDRQPIGV